MITPELHFLGWNAPAIDLVAKRLLHGLTTPQTAAQYRRATVVVPTAESGRRLREVTAERAGKPILMPKIILAKSPHKCEWKPCCYGRCNHRRMVGGTEKRALQQSAATSRNLCKRNLATRHHHPSAQPQTPLGRRVLHPRHRGTTTTHQKKYQPNRSPPSFRSVGTG